MIILNIFIGRRLSFYFSIALVMLLSFCFDTHFVAAEHRIPDRFSCDYLANEDCYSVSSLYETLIFTVTTVPDDNTDQTSINITIEVPSHGFDAQQLIVTGLTKAGKKIDPSSSSVKTQSIDNKLIATVSTVCPGKRRDIDRLLIENRKPTSPKPMQIDFVQSEFPHKSLGSWGAINDLDEDCQVVMTNDKLSMTLPDSQCHDLHPNRPLNAPFVLHQISGDFTIQVKVTSDFTPGQESLDPSINPFNGAGILLWESEDNYFRVERNAFRMRPDKMSCYPPLIEHWKQQRCVGFNDEVVDATFFEGKSTWLKVTRKAQEIAISISHDGIKWKEIKSLKPELSDELFVGVDAINTSNAPFALEFEEYSLKAECLVVPAVFKEVRTTGN